ncbi:toxic anion resistance protein [Rhodovulum sp. DZ06]|uniref:toxic anion resistance protein n=1 Tax=Rhodovulum sp. DZ06 TaxID=3425126 RepID=UPI003D359654
MTDPNTPPQTELEQIAREAKAQISVALREPEAATPAYGAGDPETQTRIEELRSSIDVLDSRSVMTFGSQAQQNLTALSDRMLEGVRAKDTGPAGEALSNMVSTLRGFNVDELDPGRKQSWWDKLLGRATPVAQFVASYEDVRGHIDDISDELLRHESVLLKDIALLDRLYEESLGFYDELGLFIAAGEEALRRLDAVDIPQKEAWVTNAGPDQAGIAAQELRDLRAGRDDLERRVHDLKLTRQVTMQSLPSIRLVQENDKGLVGRIGSTLVNTVPLWRTQLAQAVTIARSREAAGALKEATDLTNELLTKNAEQLGEANREVRTQMERGVFDIEAVREANARLVKTIEESLQIADEGKRRRAAAEAELQKLEGDLKAALIASHAPAAVNAAGGDIAEAASDEPQGQAPAPSQSQQQGGA